MLIRVWRPPSTVNSFNRPGWSSQPWWTPERMAARPPDRMVLAPRGQRGSGGISVAHHSYGKGQSLVKGQSRPWTGDTGGVGRPVAVRAPQGAGASGAVRRPDPPRRRSPRRGQPSIMSHSTSAGLSTIRAGSSQSGHGIACMDVGRLQAGRGPSQAGTRRCLPGARIRGYGRVMQLSAGDDGTTGMAVCTRHRAGRARSYLFSAWMVQSLSLIHI